MAGDCRDQHRGYEWHWSQTGQQQHPNGDAHGDGFAPHRRKILFQAIQHKQIVAGLEAADGIHGCLQQQDIPLPENDLTKALLNRFLAAAQGQHSRVMALPEAQLPKTGTGQGRPSR